MMKKRASFINLLFGLTAICGLFIQDENGRKGFYAGAPGDLTCTDCHSDIAHGGTGLSITGAPSNFVAGQSYPLTLTLNDPIALTGGFQIVATNNAVGNNAMYGTFTAGTGSKIASSTGNGAGRLTHNTPKSFTGGNVSWTFHWTAPMTGSGVKFYYAGNASNGDLDETVGDAIYTGSHIIIPVELMSFDGKKVGETVELTWKTASERDNRHFTIERSSENKADKFEPIGTINAKGNSTSIQTYEFLDEKPLTNLVNYYRLKQVDLDGKTTYSKVISIANKGLNKTIKILPSIVSSNSEITIQTSELAAANFEIVDMSGRVVLMVHKAADTEGVKFSLSGLSTGRYFVRSTPFLAFQSASFLVF